MNQALSVMTNSGAQYAMNGKSLYEYLGVDDPYSYRTVGFSCPVKCSGGGASIPVGPSTRMVAKQQFITKRKYGNRSIVL